MSTLTQLQVDELKEKVYQLLIQNDDLGLGDMDSATETAGITVNEWLTENKIQVID